MTQTNTRDDAAALTESLYAAAAEALTATLPVTVPVSTQLAAQQGESADPGGTGSLVTASFVGEASADLALNLNPEFLGGSAALDPSVVSVADVLRPALEAATGVLGTGVLSSTGPEAAAGVLADSAAAFFRLVSGERAIGWFAIRLRDPHAAQALGGSTLPAPHQRRSDADHTDVTSRLNRLRNVHMGLTVEIGRARVSVRDVLDLEPGAVIELDRNAGAPADVRLNGRLIAQGEVVVMDQDYGVRITRILDAAEGLQ